MTEDVILTIGLLLVAGLAARVLADAIGLPDIVLLIAFGALLGPSVLDVVDVPLDSLGAQLLFTLGVSAILFYRRAQPVARPALRPGRASALGPLGDPRRHPHRARHRRRPRRWSSGSRSTEALLIGAVLSPTDPAILIPLFVRLRLRVRRSRRP